MTDKLHLFSSLSPNPKRAARQLTCFESWVEKGALVHLIQRVRDSKSIDEDILANVFSYHEIDGDGPVPFAEILLHASTIDGHVLILNADNELIAPAEKLKQFDSFVGAGLMVIPRCESKNTDERVVVDEPYDPFERLAVRGYERQGIEGIYLKITAELIAYCKRSPIEFRIGEPWWDVIVPHYYVKDAGLGDGDLWAPAGPVALHEPHEQMWNPTLSHINAVAASAVMKIPVRNSPEELNRMHECVSCSIRSSIAYVTNEMLQQDAAFRQEFDPNSQTYPKLTTAQLGDVLVGPDTENLQSSGPEEIEETEQLENACGQQEPPNGNAGPALASEPNPLDKADVLGQLNRIASRRGMSNVLGVAMLCSMLPTEIEKPHLTAKEQKILKDRKGKRDGNA